MKKLRYSLPLVGVFVVGLTAAVAAASQPARPVATPMAAGTLAAPAHAVFVAPSATGPSATVADVSAVQVVKIELAPGGAFPWHQHPGPVWVVVTRGTLTLYSAACDAHTYAAGSVFLEPSNLTHTARNEGVEPLEVIATFMLPADAGAASVPAPDPGTCPFEA
jgi:quercetin dioxygenase-like cupin family protein